MLGAISIPFRQAHTLTPLKYPLTALQPYISKETLEYHHGKHHQGYVNKLNSIIEGKKELQNKSIVELVRSQQGVIFNQAAQIYNHTFYFDGLTGDKSKQEQNKYSLKNSERKNIPVELLHMIYRDFGSFENFEKTFSEKCTNHFGSGWIWLVYDGKTKKLSTLDTHDAHCPITEPQTIPLLTCDVWEHAYYIDCRNVRNTYVDNFWNVVDWNVVHDRLKQARE